VILQLDFALSERLVACAASQGREPEEAVEELVLGWVETCERSIVRDDQGEIIGNSEEIDDVLGEARFNEWLERNGNSGETLAE